MGSSQSDQEFHCPECGALLTVGADHCWKCRREFFKRRRLPDRRPSQRAAPPELAEAAAFRRSRARHVANPLSSGENGIRLFKDSGRSGNHCRCRSSAAFFATCLGGFFASSAIGPGGEAGLGQAIVIGLISRQRSGPRRDYWSRLAVLASPAQETPPAPIGPRGVGSELDLHGDHDRGRGNRHGALLPSSAALGAQQLADREPGPWCVLWWHDRGQAALRSRRLARLPSWDRVVRRRQNDHGRSDGRIPWCSDRGVATENPRQG